MRLFSLIYHESAIEANISPVTNGKHCYLLLFIVILCINAIEQNMAFKAVERLHKDLWQYKRNCLVQFRGIRPRMKSRIYFSNVGDNVALTLYNVKLTLYNVTLTSHKPC